MNCRKLLPTAIVFLLGFAVPGTAQTANEPATETASHPSRDQRSFTDKARDWVKDNQIIERLQGDVDGWYPRLGGLKRGGGFGGGPGYRTHILHNLMNEGVLLDVSGALSARFYKAIDVKARWIAPFHQRVELWTDYRFEDDPQEDFFGLGPGSALNARTSYTYRASDLALRAEMKPVKWVHAGARLGVLHPWITRGRDPLFPSIEQRFTDASAPGLAEQPTFLYASLYGDIDSRDVAGNPRRGGFYHAAFGQWNDQSFNAYDFRRFDANATQYIPLNATATHILSPRIGLGLVNNAPGQRVPFYYMPSVGGSDTIRSFREFRFSDENALWLGAEYRWVATKWVSLALFTDAGKVTHAWSDMGLTDLKQAYGGGVLIHSAKQTFARVYIGAGGGEGVRTYLQLGL